MIKQQVDQMFLNNLCIIAQPNNLDKLYLYLIIGYDVVILKNSFLHFIRLLNDNLDCTFNNENYKLLTYYQYKILSKILSESKLQLIKSYSYYITNLNCKQIKNLINYL